MVTVAIFVCQFWRVFGCCVAGLVELLIELPTELPIESFTHVLATQVVTLTLVVSLWLTFCSSHFGVPDPIGI